MDISSKYYTLLRKREIGFVKHLFGFLRSAYRVGKLTELSSFCLWETKHRLHLYSRRQYVTFTTPPGSSFSDSTPDSLPNVIPAGAGIEFEPLAIDWKFCLEAADGLTWGSTFSNPDKLYCSADHSESTGTAYTFPGTITSMFISQDNLLFVCANGCLYRSSDKATSFQFVLQLSSPISYFLFNNGMTELPNGTLILGEYGSIWRETTWQNLAYVYYSTDQGKTWDRSDFLQQNGVNKHVHLIRYSHTLDATFLTDGDNKKQLWINSSLTNLATPASSGRNGWSLVNRFHHQGGGYVSFAETNDTVLFGSDYLGGTNFLVSTKDGNQYTKQIMPDPYRRSPIMNMVIRKTPAGNEIWAVSYSCLSQSSRSLLMVSRDGGCSWEKILDFAGTHYEVRLVNSSPEPTERLYISITSFGQSPSEYRHQVYALVDKNLCHSLTESTLDDSQEQLSVLSFT